MNTASIVAADNKENKRPQDTVQIPSGQHPDNARLRSLWCRQLTLYFSTGMRNPNMVTAVGEPITTVKGFPRAWKKTPILASSTFASETKKRKLTRRGQASPPRPVVRSHMMRAVRARTGHLHYRHHQVPSR